MKACFGGYRFGFLHRLTSDVLEEIELGSEGKRVRAGEDIYKNRKMKTQSLTQM